MTANHHPWGRAAHLLGRHRPPHGQLNLSQKSSALAWVQIITPVGALRIYSAVIGRHNVPHMLAAVATALAASIPGTQISLAVSAAAAGSYLGSEEAWGSCLHHGLVHLQPAFPAFRSPCLCVGTLLWPWQQCLGNEVLSVHC